MYSVAVNTSAFANIVTPFSPVGKQAVGLETAEAKEEVFAPVEEPTSNSPTFDKEDTSKTEQQAREQIEERQQREQQRRDQQLIQELANRDREVRAHEQAHASVGGQYAGAPSFNFERGPDGVNYAVGGEVPISLPTGTNNPEEKLAAAEQVRRAALAPAEPSPQDRSVAANASQLAVEARAEIAAQQAEETAEAREQSELQRQQEEEKEQQLAEEREEAEAREARLEELRALSRRSTQLSEQLVTLDSISRDQNVGSVLDQLA